MTNDIMMEEFEAEVMTALRDLARRPEIVVSIRPLVAFFLMSQLQLAFRYPANIGPSRTEVVRFAEDLRGQVTPPGSVLDRLIDMGYDERFDR